jgi:hypothetical protein
MPFEVLSNEKIAINPWSGLSAEIQIPGIERSKRSLQAGF